MVEAWAVMHGLEMAWQTGGRKIILEVDSLLLTGMIKEQSSQQCLTPLLCKIKDLIARDWVVNVQHVYREVNICADYLANMGHNMILGVHGLNTPPTEMFQLLQTDMVGVCIPRSYNLR